MHHRSPDTWFNCWSGRCPFHPVHRVRAAAAATRSPLRSCRKWKRRCSQRSQRLPRGLQRWGWTSTWRYRFGQAAWALKGWQKKHDLRNLQLAIWSVQWWNSAKSENGTIALVPLENWLFEAMYFTTKHRGLCRLSLIPVLGPKPRYLRSGFPNVLTQNRHIFAEDLRNSQKNPEITVETHSRSSLHPPCCAGCRKSSTSEQTFRRTSSPKTLGISPTYFRRKTSENMRKSPR